MEYPSLLRFSVLFFALAMPMAGCAGNDNPPHKMDKLASQVPAQPQAEDPPQDCSGISSLTDKRTCYGRQDQAMIDECERIHPMRCSPYREMARAEARLAEVEEASLAAAEAAYSSYVENDAAYLSDLKTSAHKANLAWVAYREAQCSLEPFAQGMSRNESENLTEACRVRMTQARMDELIAFYPRTGGGEARP